MEAGAISGICNQKLYSASMKHFYILFKRVKQYAMIYLAGYLLKPWIFLYTGFTFSMAFSRFDVSLQIIQMGMRRIISCAFEFVSTDFILYGMSLILLIKRNFKKKGRNAL